MCEGSVVQSIRLVKARGEQEDEYLLELIQLPALFSVNFLDLRPGQPSWRRTATPTPVSYAEAKKVYDALLQQRLTAAYASASQRPGTDRIRLTLA